MWARPSNASWKLGEDFNYVIRDMANPNSYSQPDTYQGTYWKTTSCTPSSTNDYCGVHTNSGVLNFWYYLLVSGGSGTNDKGFVYSVSGLGLDKAAAIAYRTLTTYLTSSSTYADARTYSLQSASDLYGATSNEVTQTTNAWDAVGVGGGTAPAAAATTTTAVASVYKVASNNNNVLVNFNSKTTDVRTVELISVTGKASDFTTFTIIDHSSADLFLCVLGNNIFVRSGAIFNWDQHGLCHAPVVYCGRDGRVYDGYEHGAGFCQFL